MIDDEHTDRPVVLLSGFCEQFVYLIFVSNVCL